MLINIDDVVRLRQQAAGNPPQRAFGRQQENQKITTETRRHGDTEKSK